MLNWNLGLIENALNYANKHIITHNKMLEVIIYLCLFEEESVVFEKGLDLIHTLIISLSSIYPLDLHYVNKNLREKK